MNRWPSRAGGKAPINRTRSKRFALAAESAENASAFGVRASSAPLSQGRLRFDSRAGSLKAPTTLMPYIGTMNPRADSRSAGILAGDTPTGNTPARMPAHPGSWKAGSMPFELSALAAIIVLLNLPLLHGACAVNMIFLPDNVAAGEWWRLFTHAFVHVSWYHLLLDATAFLILYQGLVGRSGFERMGYVLACGAGSLLASLWSAPIIQTHGLCGLSGIAHGLMAIASLDQMTGPTDKTIRRAGAVTFIIVVTKSIIEAFTGRIVFESLHLGALGSPVAVCHAGGVLAGLGAWVIAQLHGTSLASRPILMMSSLLKFSVPSA